MGIEGPMGIFDTWIPRPILGLFIKRLAAKVALFEVELRAVRESFKPKKLQDALNF
jgi:hypothetical protein